jgi:hypothetical protein
MAKKKSFVNTFNGVYNFSMNCIFTGGIGKSPVKSKIDRASIKPFSVPTGVQNFKHPHFDIFYLPGLRHGKAFPQLGMSFAARGFPAFFCTA